MSDNNSSTGGVTTAGLLGVLFIGLKLGHVIDWPWLWVLSPFWIPMALVLAILLIAGIVIGAGKALDRAADKKVEKRRAKRLRNL
jgi:hypothetical protein